MLVDDTRLTSPRAGAGRTQAEIDQIHAGLRQRFEELDAEYQRTVAESQTLNREQLSDTAGDDDADSGAKSSERERELSLIRSIGDRRAQVLHALERLSEGAYGWCEECSDPIPVERLAVFPWATACVSCKQQRERRAG
ncbi:MAG TPA: TraR/DksA C4-type zinc finger protein [Pilimelia sp.]|nr:TraR/DksA C4-type zinc finger protein [Pilimelia sp.]